jgi:hypothetical protein
MAELYKVVVTYYECGWEQRNDPETTKHFATLEEAEKYKAYWEENDPDSPDDVWQAEITKL